MLRACHQRGADRLLQLCFANGGIYTKLGQHVGQLVRWARLGRGWGGRGAGVHTGGRGLLGGMGGRGRSTKGRAARAQGAEGLEGWTRCWVMCLL